MALTKFEDLKGHTIIDIKRGYVTSAIRLSQETHGDALLFTLADNSRYKMYHERDCCESVYIDQIDGDLNDLLNSPILMAEESEYVTDPSVDSNNDEYGGWTFYKLATIKGYVTIRWQDFSNRWYSTAVDLEPMNTNDFFLVLQKDPLDPDKLLTEPEVFAFKPPTPTPDNNGTRNVAIYGPAYGIGSKWTDWSTNTKYILKSVSKYGLETWELLDGNN